MRKRTYKKYTKEAEEYLKEKWGIRRPYQIVGAINRMTGDKKTFENITLKARKLGLETIKEAYNIITLTDIGNALNNTNLKTLRKWGIPCDKISKNSKYYYVNIKEFWKWAYINRGRINFKRYEVGSLLPEPKWLLPYIKEQDINEHHMWTEQEEAALKIYKSHGKTNAYVSDKLGIKESQVYDKLRYMKRYKATDLTTKDKKYTMLTETEKKKILELQEKGLNYSEIAREVGCAYNNARRFCIREKAAKQGAKDE